MMKYCYYTSQGKASCISHEHWQDMNCTTKILLCADECAGKDHQFLGAGIYITFTLTIYYSYEKYVIPRLEELVIFASAFIGATIGFLCTIHILPGVHGRYRKPCLEV